METLFKTIEVFDSKLDGYSEFWSLFPRDKRRPSRKSGGTPKLGRNGKCQRIWIKLKMYEHKDQVMASLLQDIRDINKGVYRRVNSPDTMEFFPMITTWMNNMNWARDIEPEPKVKPEATPAQPQVVHNVMTAEEKAKMIPIWREMARGKACQNITTKRLS